MIRLCVFLLLVLLFFCGLTTGDYDEEYNYYDDYDSNLVPQKQVLAIQNATQNVVVRLMQRGNRIVDKKMKDASALCTRKAAILDDTCGKCGGRNPHAVKTVLAVVKEIVKHHPIFWPVKIGHKVLKDLRRVRVRRILNKVGKTVGRIGKDIGKTWNKVTRTLGRNINRLARNIGRNIHGVTRRVGRHLQRLTRRLTGQLRRLLRVRLPRIKLPRIRFRLPPIRYRLPRFRYRLPRFRYRLPRFRYRLPRIRYRLPRFRFRFKKRSSCDQCKRFGNLKKEDFINALCPFMKAVKKECSEILQRLEKMTPEIEKGYPTLEKIKYGEYPNSDEAVVSISLRKAKRTYILKQFDRLSSAQAGRILGRYIYNNI